MTTSGTFSVTIQSPPETVWPWIAHLDKHTEWSPKPYRVELVSGEPNTVGSKYRSIGWVPGDKNHVNDVEITEVVTNSRFALRAHEEMGIFENTYDLRSTGGNTEVTFRIVFPPMKGMSALLVPVLFPLVGKAEIRKRMGLLKAKVETGR
jgi:uncharacterized protein YndB with AHSA1/START domain